VRAVIIVPCFNEQARWQQDYWQDMVRHINARFIFVDDGSTDQTAPKLQAFVEEHETSATFLGLPHNVGKAEAIRHGWLKALMEDELGHAPELIGFLDADGAFSAHDVKRALMLMNNELCAEHFDACWSSRVALAGRDIRRSMKRHYLGRLVATYLSLGQSQIPYDTQSGFKLFHVSPELIDTLGTPFQTRWLFEVEMLARFERLTGRPMRIWEMPLDSWVDIAGSSITIRESTRIARELLRLKSIQRKARKSLVQLDDRKP
jgi:dolichyl-phosphate beta-glucosyltransferase